MPILYTMCGLPGSGKSTYAKQHPECVVISSDEVRKELYGDEAIQGDGAKVFEIVNCRVEEALDQGFNVIYDATNVASKTRKNIVNRFNAIHICVFVNTSIEECLRRNANRSRNVPQEVIERMAKKLTVPTELEGFTKIIEITP